MARRNSNESERSRKKRETVNRQRKSTSGAPGMSLRDKVNVKLRELERRGKMVLKPAQGVNTIRVLPSWRGDNEEFYFETAIHYDVGPNSRTVNCNRTYNKRCPICDRADRLLERSPDNQVTADELRPNDRINMNIIVRGEEEAGVQIWSTTPRMLQDLLGYFADADYGDFTDPQDGFDIRLRRKGEGMRTR